MELKGKNAIVTGAARGIGRGIALNRRAGRGRECRAGGHGQSAGG